MKLLKIIFAFTLPLILILGCKKDTTSTTSTTTTTTTSSTCPTDNNTITCSYTATSSTDDCSFLTPAQTAYTDLRSGTCSTVTTIPCAKAPRTFGIEERMKNVLFIFLIYCFSLTIIYCLTPRGGEVRMHFYCIMINNYLSRKK